MQELEEAERYSIAGLFTLALHSAASQADAGGETWGEAEEGAPLPDAFGPGSPDPFWGRDLAACGGLLDAVYFQLGLPAFKWAGLRALPTVAPTTDTAAFRSAIHSLIAVLDTDLAASMPTPAPPKGRTDEAISPHASRVAVPDELWDGILSSSDDDGEAEHDEAWERQLEAEQMALQGQYKGAQGGRGSRNDDDGIWSVDSPSYRDAQETLRALASPGRRGHVNKQRSDDYSALVRQLEELTAQEEKLRSGKDTSSSSSSSLEGKLAAEQEIESGKEGTPAPAARPRSARDISPIALAALWELLQCCIGASLAAGEAAQQALSEGGTGRRPGSRTEASSPKVLQRQGPPPCVRWYDSRARVALRLVSSWLQVPAKKLATLEVLLGSDKAPTSLRTHRNGMDSVAADRYRYLKVGLAALGGGALFAVTGGLAAPAIAAGVGSLLGVVPGAGAAAGVVAGFMSTQVGVAAVTTTMATAGAATTGSKMAYRTADVKDFGFRELREAAAPAALAAQAQQTQRRDSALLPSRESSANGLAVAGAAAQSRKGSLALSSEDESSSDPGHLSFSPPKQGGRMDRRPSGPSPLPSRCGDSAVPSTPGVHGQREASSSGNGDAETSTWKSWFGKKPAPEETLLPTPLRPARPAEGVKLSAVIAVSGWITSPEDFATQWQSIRAPSTDKFALVWCTSELQTLNSALGQLLAKGAAGQAARFGMQHLLVGGAGLVTALGPTVILGAATGLLIENAWTVAGDRADKAGKLLAQVLMNGGAGGRPVTLVSHSMGSRLVFSALLELCRNGARGLVQDVVLLGAPVSPHVERWRMARRVVAGRLVNGYSRRDWLLGVMYWHGVAKPAAGLAPVEVEGVENVSLGSIVGGHFEYMEHCEEILSLLGVPG